MTLQRSFAGMACLCATVALVAGCYATPTPHTAEFQANCAYFDSPIIEGPKIDYGAHSLAISYEAPTWTNPGETVPVDNVTITGLFMPELFAGNRVEVQLKVGDVTSTLTGTAPSDGVAPTNFGSATYVATAGDTSDDIVLTGVFGYVTPDNVWWQVGRYAECHPAAPGATVGTITKRGPAVTTTTTTTTTLP